MRPNSSNNQPKINVTSTSTPRRRPGSSGEIRRVNSPVISGRLQVPGSRQSVVVPDSCSNVWCEDEAELIKSCGAISQWLGMPRSFSTGDIARLRDDDRGRLQRSLSETALSGERLADWNCRRLDRNSRSCSTWVAVGDLASSSQLPSPQGRTRPSVQSPFTPADLVLTVNKKMRHNYIRRRLNMTFRALQRLSRTDFQLQQLFRGAAAAGLYLPPVLPTAAAVSAVAAEQPVCSNTTAPAVAAEAAIGESRQLPKGISVLEVNRECGRPLSRYQRNILVFNWLQSLDPEQTQDS